ncbi:Uncharacterised protein [Mycobacteroides abscessus subsp. abscessus]|nr:Uncharacterised protein [Mycobacteroides abscessus subsp. abscessus]
MAPRCLRCPPCHTRVTAPAKMRSSTAARIGARAASKVESSPGITPSCQSGPWGARMLSSLAISDIL